MKKKQEKPAPLGRLSPSEREVLEREARFCTVADQATSCSVSPEVFRAAARGDDVPIDVIEKIRKAYKEWGLFPTWGPAHLSWWAGGNGG